MNVSNKTTRMFTIFDVTEAQAQDLLSICLALFPSEVTASEKETLNNLRQALLNAGVTKTKGADE